MVFCRKNLYTSFGEHVIIWNSERLHDGKLGSEAMLLPK